MFKVILENKMKKSMFTYRKETTDVDVDVQCFAFKVGNVDETVLLMMNKMCVFQNEAKKGCR